MKTMFQPLFLFPPRTWTSDFPHTNKHSVALCSNPCAFSINFALNFVTTCQPNIFMPIRNWEPFQNCLEWETEHYTNKKEPRAVQSLGEDVLWPWRMGLPAFPSFLYGTLSHSRPVCAEYKYEDLISLVLYACGIAKLFLCWLLAPHFWKPFYSLSNIAWWLMTILQLLSVYYFNQYIINQEEECWTQLEGVACTHYLGGL